MLNKYIGYTYFFLILILSIIPFTFLYQKELYLNIVKEDGIVEYSTALFLLSSAFISLYDFFKIKIKFSVNNFGLIFTALILFFGFGEELSWGQRIFNIESSSFFNKNNLQGETNIHNLMIQGVKLNKWIFTYGLVVVFTFYFLVLPIFYKKNIFPKSLNNNFSFVIPRFHQSLIFILSTLFINLLNYERISELWEFSFAVTIFYICISPLNKKGNLLQK